MRSVEEEGSQAAANKSGNGNRHDPREDEEADSLPVDSLESAVAETNTDGGAGNAHGSRDGKLVLGEDKDSDGSTHFHGRATARGVVSDLVTHDY